MPVFERDWLEKPKVLRHGRVLSQITGKMPKKLKKNGIEKLKVRHHTELVDLFLVEFFQEFLGCMPDIL